LPVFTEMMIKANDQIFGIQLFNQIITYKLIRTQQGEFPGKRMNNEIINSGLTQQFSFFFIGIQANLITIGEKYGSRMRIKGQNSGFSLNFLRRVHQFANNFPVAGVYAIKSADGNNKRFAGFKVLYVAE
jgi:hypothetical protein